MKALFSEAIKLKDGQLYNLSYHQERVNRTAANFGYHPVDLSVLSGEISSSMRQGLYKCRVVYADGIKEIEITPYTFRQTDRVAVITANDLDYAFKYADRTALNHLLRASECDDIIIIKNGLVTDSFAANVVFESAEGLFTPCNCLLPGTRRQHLLDLGVVQERDITVADIRNYDRVYFINAMIGLEDKRCVETSVLRY